MSDGVLQRLGDAAMAPPGDGAHAHALLRQLARDAAAAASAARQGRQPASGGAVKAVQDGLRDTQQQLRALLARHDPAGSVAVVHELPPSMAVLQQLLELAVGGGAPGDDAAAAGAAPRQRAACRRAAPATAAQQQRWGAAALEALQLFPVCELERLPARSLQQALLLWPPLLDQLLQAAAATVLQPLLPTRLDGADDSNSCEREAQQEACSSLQKLLAQRHPCWQQLPAVLAASPLLLAQATATLLRWLESSGHPRLWQLLSLTCRPAWQQLFAGAPAEAAQQAAPLAGGSSCALAGACWLLCPQPWQQQLVAQLAQEPSTQGLRQLLQLLPGTPCPLPSPPVAQPGPATAADAASCAALTWPSDDEWQGSWQGLAAAAAAGGTATATCSSSTDVAVSSPVRAAEAWQLVAQHRCWYEFACCSLVHCSLRCCQATDEQQQWEQQAERAAAFIAWLQEPVDCTRRQRLQQQLLSAIATAGSACSARHQPGASVGGAAQLCSHMLAAWRQALHGEQQQQQPDAAGAPGCSALADLDLPAAVMLQLELLAGCEPREVVQVCFEHALPSAAPGTEQRAVQQQRQAAAMLLDALDSACAAALEVLAGCLRSKALELAPGLQQPGDQQQQPGASHAGSSWLASLWSAELQRSRDDSGAAGQRSPGPQLASAKQLLAAATACDAYAKRALTCSVSREPAQAAECK